MLFACSDGSREDEVNFPESKIKTLGKVHPDIDEASGLVASRKYPGLLWTHNDSGDKPRIFLIKTDGTLVATVYLENVVNRDWEDITFYKTEDKDKFFLCIGDIGDNSAIYPYLYIYKIEEPEIDASKTEQLIFIKDIDKTVYQYPDGSRDAETLLFDPLDNRLFVISKREKNVRLYGFPDHHTWNDTVTLEMLTELPIYLAVAGDVSTDGQEILIKDYEKIYYWSRDKSESLADALKKAAIELPYTPEKQGESLAWDLHAKGFFTLSEMADSKDMPNIIYHGRK